MNRTQKRTKRAAPPSEGLGPLLKHSTIGAGVAILAATLLALLGAALCLLSEDPVALTMPVGLISLYLAAALGGMTAVRLQKGAALLCGLLCGGLITVFFWFFTLFFPHAEQGFSFPLALLFRALTIGIAILGAILGLKKQSPHHRKRRK